MWPMFTNSLRLFLKGKLFRDPKAVLLRWFAGFAIALVAVVILRTARRAGLARRRAGIAGRRRDPAVSVPRPEIRLRIGS